MPESIANDKEFLSLLDLAVDQGASDIHLLAGVAPQIRVDSLLKPVDQEPYSDEKANAVIAGLIGSKLYHKISEDKKELDFSFNYRTVRFRTNVFFEKGVLSASMRLLTDNIRDLATLGVPAIAGKLLEHNQGLIIVSGPTGHGKSTTLAAMVDQLSSTRKGHIITVEDPIEYLLRSKKSIVTQREVGTDTPSFPSALRSALREDPDIVMVGEMRDLETIEAVLQIAETGHLVLSSLHTNSAAQTANRIVDVFPPHQREWVQTQLSEVLIGVISQRLLRKVQGGRILACEVMLANTAISALIREGKTHQIPNQIQTSAAEGMMTLDKSLADLVARGEVAIDDALAWAIDPKALKMQIY